MKKNKRHLHSFSLIAFLIVLPSICFAKLFNEPPLPSNYTEQCLSEIMAHPLAQNITSGDFNEYFDLCKCILKKNPALDEPQHKISALDFMGPEKHLATLDQCAIKTLSKNNLEKYFVILVTTKFEALLYDKIKGYMPSGTSMIAHESSIEDTTLCIQKNILNNCTKVHAFSLAYQCIKDVFQESIISKGTYQKILSTCPQLSSDAPALFDKNNSIFL